MLTLFHDYTSPGSAVAVARLQRLADDGLRVEFVGFEAIGVDMALPVTVDVLAEIGAVGPAAAAEGVVLRRPHTLAPTGLAHVVGELADVRGRGASWRRRCYHAFWAQGADLGDRSVLLDLATDVGLPEDQAVRALEDRLALAEIRRRTGQHRREGVGGVPTILTQRTLVPGLLPEADLRALAQL